MIRKEVVGLSSTECESQETQHPVRLVEGESCPICSHVIREAYYYHGEGGTNEYLNVCDKCSFSDNSVIGDSEYYLKIEDFEWAFHYTDKGNDVNKKAEELNKVISAYQKIWNGESLGKEEDSELDKILVAQDQKNNQCAQMHDLF